MSGVCESRYIDIADITARGQKGELPNLGEATSPDIERLLMILPEAIMTSPLQNVGYGRLGKTGIPILDFTDYM